MCFLSLCICANLVYAERVTHPTNKSLVFSLVGRTSTFICYLGVLFKHCLEDCMERKQIKPKDFVVVSLCLYEFPLNSFFFQYCWCDVRKNQAALLCTTFKGLILQCIWLNYCGGAVMTGFGVTSQQLIHWLITAVEFM